MKEKTKLAAVLLASASMLGGGAAFAANTQIASASTQSQTEETITMTAAPQDAGGSPSTSNAGTIDVQGAGQVLGSGYIIPEDGPKDRSTVTHQGINNLLPTANPFNAIAILPGVNQFQDDAVGLSGGTIRVRGLVAAQMGFTVNGAPVNDSGNFAIFPQEYVDTEDLDQVWVTQGSTDIDAPHVGASGGNIGIVTRAPLDTFNVKVSESGGDLELLREYASIDTGWIGPIKGFVSYSHAEADKWRGDGRDDRYHTDGNFIWQVTPHSSIGITWAYNNSFNDSYRSYAGSSSFNVTTPGNSALQTFNLVGPKVDNDTFWGQAGFPINLTGPNSSASCATNASPTCTVINPFFPAIGKTNASNAQGLQLNPFRNLIATVPVHVQLTDNLRWDTNGYLWYGSGNGGFGTTSTEGRLSGPTYIHTLINGVEVPNIYGNTGNSTNALLLYEASVTRTVRPGMTTKFTYDWDNYTFVAGGWIEHAHHSQTEPFSLVNSNATPCDAWLTEVSNNSCALFGTAIATNAPAQLQGRNLLTSSIGQAVFAEAQGRFFDDSLKVTVGVSYRDIHRSIHDRLPVCADDPNLPADPTTLANSGGATVVSCTTANANSSAFLNSAAFRLFGGMPGQSAAANVATYQAMQAFAQNPHADFNAALPEFNASYEIDTNNQVFASLSSGFRTPSNFIFSTFNGAGTIFEATSVKSETNWTYEAGYRFHGESFVASATGYLQDLRDYQATVQLDPTDFITSNIGGVKIYGVDFEAGTTPWHHFTVYGSAEVQNSLLAKDLSADACGAFGAGGCTPAQNNAGIQLFVHTRGKRLVDTPNWIVSGSVGYENQGFFASVTPHCQGNRPTSLLNDEVVPSSCTVDASAGYHFDANWGALKDATLQIYGLNIFDSSHLGEITTQGQTNVFTAPAFSPSAPGQAFTVPSESYSAKPVAPLFVGVKLTVNLGH